MVETIKVEVVGLVLQLGIAVLIWIVGKYLIERTDKFLNNLMDRKKIDLSLKTFSRSFLKSILYIVLIIVVVSTLGFQTSSLVAVLGAAGLAVGLALQGSLSNFAGGILIIIFKPFGVGDFIEAGNNKGTVKEVQIFSTILDTPDNRRIIIPNSQLSNNVIMNYSKNDTRRIDFVFSVSYTDDLKVAKEIITKILSNHEKILKDKGVFVKLSEYADSSINFTGRVWSKREDYWDIYFDVLDVIKDEFDKAGLNIPYPQMDIHINK